MKLTKLATAVVVLQAADAQTYSFEQGSNATIECVPDGDTVLALFKNDNILFTQSAGGPQTIGTSRFTTDLDNSSYSSSKTTEQAKLVLKLNDVSLDDEAQYSCENDKGNTKTIEINVTVKPKVALETKPLDIKEGATEALVATCTASGAKPQPDIVWKDDQGTDYPADVTTKPSDDPRLTTVTSELKLTDISRSHHQRKFTCTVKQADIVVGEETTDTVNVQWAPTNVAIKGDTTYTEDNAASIVCSADANPEPNYSWQVQRNNETEPSDPVTWIVDGSTLSNNAVKLSDNQMKVICVATNDIGSSQADTLVNITAKPTSAPTSVADGIGGGAGKGAIVYSTIGVICVIVLIAGFLLAKKVLCAKKAVYKTEGDKDEAHENLNDDELEAGKKKEYFM